MKKEKNYLAISLKLPKNFEKTLRASLEEEFDEAVKKWGVRLSQDERASVIYHSLKQLENKVSSVAREPWRTEDDTLIVLVSTEKKGTINLTLPDASTEKYAVEFVRAHDEWKVNTDPNVKAVPIGEFYDYYLAEVVKWGRTAVFYGVGSYA